MNSFQNLIHTNFKGNKAGQEARWTRIGNKALERSHVSVRKRQWYWPWPTLATLHSFNTLIKHYFMEAILTYSRRKKSTFSPVLEEKKSTFDCYMKRNQFLKKCFLWYYKIVFAKKKIFSTSKNFSCKNFRKV